VGNYSCLRDILKNIVISRSKSHFFQERTGSSLKILLFITWPVFSRARALKKTFEDDGVCRAIRLFQAGPYKSVRPARACLKKSSIKMSFYFWIRSYDKMLIDWVRSGRTGKYLALGHMVRTASPEPNIFLYSPPAQSISTYSFSKMSKTFVFCDKSRKTTDCVSQNLWSAWFFGPESSICKLIHPFLLFILLQKQVEHEFQMPSNGCLTRKTVLFHITFLFLLSAFLRYQWWLITVDS